MSKDAKFANSVVEVPFGHEVVMFYTHQPTTIPGLAYTATAFDTRPANPSKNQSHGNLVESRSTITTSPFGLIVSGYNKEGENVRAILPYAGIKMYLLK